MDYRNIINKKSKLNIKLKKYNKEKKKLSEIFNICNYCYCELASDQQMMLSDKYKNFLYYHEDSESNSSESSNSDDDQDN
jgi:hypothetical protein